MAVLVASHSRLVRAMRARLVMCLSLLARRLQQMLLVAVCLFPLVLVRRVARPSLVAELARLVRAARCLLSLEVRKALERGAASALSLAMPASPVPVAMSALLAARARVRMADQ